MISRRKLILLLPIVGFVTGCQQAMVTPPTPMKQLSEKTRNIYKVTPDARHNNNIYIPQSAIVDRGGIKAVFVLRETTARLRMVRTGRTSGKKTQIISGLIGGETILRGDLSAVYDGSPIRVGRNK
jgi:hypothetical protein